MSALFPYYGGKGHLVGKYPAPYYDHIIEPFAGSAAYAFRHGARRAVTLYDLDETLVEVWRWLIAAPVERLIALPVLGRGERVSEAPGLCEAERAFLALWASPGSSGGHTNDVISERGVTSGWARFRSNVFTDVDRIRHWKVVHGSYNNAADVEATWYVDPPYQGGETTAGDGYHHGKAALDFDALGAWVRARRGQVIACDHEDASWLPFRPLSMHQKQTNDEWRTELVYLQGPQPMTDRLGRVQRRRRPGEMIMRYPGGR